MYNLQINEDLRLTVSKAISLLDSKSRRKLAAILIIQMSSGILDLFGIIIIGALGALTIQGVESSQPGNRVSVFLRLINIENLKFQSQIAILGTLAVGVLLSKTIFSIAITRKSLIFMAKKSATLSADLVKKTISRDLQIVKHRSSQDLLYIFNEGVDSLFIGVLISILNIVGEAFMLIILISGLVSLDISTALGTVLLFTLTAMILNRLLNIRAKEIGRLVSSFTIKGNEKILEVLNSFREIAVHGQQSKYIDSIRNTLIAKSKSKAESNFQPLISKYVIESITVLGIFALAGYEFATKSATHAAATLAVFLAASSRIAPSTLRIQQAFLTMHNSAGLAKSTATLIEDLNEIDSVEHAPRYCNFLYPNFSPEVIISNLYFKYNSAKSEIIKNLSLTIQAGSKVAIVGPSGSGKTTLVDLILGILQPKSGTIEISGKKSTIAESEWSGAISYVPQDTYISNGSIRENILLGFDFAELRNIDDKIWDALRRARLYDFVDNLDDKLETNVGELGSNLSGGQKQRLGIARALFTAPKLLILDEATSSLDAQMEDQLTELFSTVDQDMTLIIIAHRLSTIKFVDKIFYIENGAILASGTFSEVRRVVPNFEKQANLLGL
jgi:ATP-binding cassette, subfamily B, bacterial PglK